MLMEETWRPGNSIITQMVKGTTRCEGVRKGVKLNRTYAMFVGDNNDFCYLFVFISFFFFLLFSSAHWLLWRQSGWKKRSWRLGLWAPSETPLLSHYNANEMDLFLWGRVCCRATKLQPPCKHQWGVHHKLSSYQFSKMANLNRCNSGLNDFSLSWGLFQFVLVVSLWPLSVSV